jgi:hypothetical protein
MTTQPETAVGSDDQHLVAAELTPEERLNAAFDDPANQKEEEPAEGEEETPAEGAEDEPEIEAQDDDLPPIDPPVSWDAEAKAKFAELPRDAQEVIAKRESERERFVQQKSQEATRAKQEAEQAAIQQVAAYAIAALQSAGILRPAGAF